MTQMIDIQVQDQFNQIIPAKALLRRSADSQSVQHIEHIEHIVVENEVILPSIELLFESQHSSNIYQVLE